MSRESTLAAFDDLNRAKWRGEEAPHKPLLALLAVSRLMRLGETRLSFREVENELDGLIRQFGFRESTSVDARLPFWHLTNDGVWRVELSDRSELVFSGQRPTRNELWDQDARGRLSDPILADLQAAPGLAWELFGRLLNDFFDPACHERLIQQVGLWPRPSSGANSAQCQVS